MPGLVDIEYLNALGIAPGLSGFTPDGGFYVQYVNRTGAASVKGTLVVASTTSGGVSTAPANADSCIGVIYDSGVANGSPVRVVIGGRAQVLLKNGEESRAGYWCACADVPGRMYQQSGVPSTSEHSREIGHSLETVSSGTNKLAWVNMHFN